MRSSEIACPVCGATGETPCIRPSKGRDHVARVRAEETARRAEKRAASIPRPWDAVAARRGILAAGRHGRTIGTDVDLAELVTLRDAVEEAIAETVAGMREREMTWAAIGEALGVGRSAAYQRYNPK